MTAYQRAAWPSTGFPVSPPGSVPLYLVLAHCCAPGGQTARSPAHCTRRGGHSRTSLQTHQLPAIHYTSDISAADWGLFLQAWGWVSTGLLSGAAQQVWSRQKRAWHNELPQRHLRFCHPNMHSAMFSKEPLVLCMKIRYLEITTWSLWVFIAPHVLVAAKTFGEQR